MDTIGRLVELTEAQGLTLFQVAQKSHVSYNTLKSAKDRGGQLSVDTIEILCSALGISLVDFFAVNQEKAF